MAGLSALIVGNGEPPSEELFAECAREADLILCADGGADTTRRLGYAPDYITGDLDSVTGLGIKGITADRLVRVDADDSGTDMQKVLLLAVQLGAERADLLGFTGRRTDHTLWNLSLLRTFGDRLHMRLIDEYCETRLINGRVRFRADAGQRLSLCPLDGPADGIETEGLRWPLKGESLLPGSRDGISNEVSASPVEIRVGSGDLLLCVQRQSASGRIEMLDPPRLLEASRGVRPSSGPRRGRRNLRSGGG